MICQVDDKVVESLRSLKGELLQLNHYKFGENTPNDGFVITGAADFFFLKTYTKIIDSKYELHLLTIDQVWEMDVDEELGFDLIEEGELSEIHIFSHTLKDVTVDKRLIGDVTSECACLVSFKDRTSCLIYPKQKLFGNCMIETDTDRILDIISSMKLHLSRTL